MNIKAGKVWPEVPGPQCPQRVVAGETASGGNAVRSERSREKIQMCWDQREQRPSSRRSHKPVGKWEPEASIAAGTSASGRAQCLHHRPPVSEHVPSPRHTRGTAGHREDAKGAGQHVGSRWEKRGWNANVSSSGEGLFRGFVCCGQGLGGSVAG